MATRDSIIYPSMIQPMNLEIQKTMIANMVIIGAYIELTGFASDEYIKQAYGKVFGDSH